MPQKPYSTWWQLVQFEKIIFPAKYDTGFRVRSGFYFYLVLRGKLAAERADQRRLLGPGQLVLLPAGAPRRLVGLQVPTEAIVLRLRYRAFAVEVEGDSQAFDILMALSRWTDREDLLLPVSPRTRTRLRDLAVRLAEEQEQERPGRSAMLKAGALEFLARLGREPWIRDEWQIPERRQPAYSNIKHALQYIAEHYPETITVADLAGAARLSRSHFQAVFRQYTGMTVLEYLNRFRIGVACRALTTTTESITAIAFDCGFNSLSRFYAAFNRFVRMSPARFRKTGAGHR